MSMTYHDTPIKGGDGNIYYPRTDLASVRNADGTKTAEEIIAELQAENEALNTSLTAVMATKTLLATATTSGTTITNSESIFNFKEILIEMRAVVGGATVVTRRLIPTSSITVGESESIINYYNASNIIDAQVKFTTATTTWFYFGMTGTTMSSFKIFGIK